jgi:hypothetical protein
MLILLYPPGTLEIRRRHLHSLALAPGASARYKCEHGFFWKKQSEKASFRVFRARPRPLH